MQDESWKEICFKRILWLFGNTCSTELRETLFVHCGQFCEEIHIRFKDQLQLKQPKGEGHPREAPSQGSYLTTVSIDSASALTSLDPLDVTYFNVHCNLGHWDAAPVRNTRGLGLVSKRIFSPDSKVPEPK
ncbi:hypothetical protein TNCV_2281501 [Trichonephila clavipes]|nr:hypothetical protein TNCV_2281501 [Trichonephila clavipes]